MTLQMYLLEEKMEAHELGFKLGERRKSEEIARKMIRKGNSFDEIHEITDLTMQRIEELAKKNSLE